MSVGLAVGGRRYAGDEPVFGDACGNPVVIDRATPADVAAIASLDAAAFPDRPWSADLWATEIAGRSWVAVVRDRCVAADSETPRRADGGASDGEASGGDLLHGDVAGVIAVSRADAASDVADLDRVIVRPDLRGRGLGDALVRAGLKWAFTLGVSRVLLEVEDTNVAARRLYDRSGFAAIGTRRNYYGSGRDAVVMEAVVSAVDVTQAGRSVSNVNQWLVCPPQIDTETWGGADE